MKKIAVFASGSGSNFKSIQNSIEEGSINGRIELFVSNNAFSGALQYAKEKKIDSFIINKKRFLNLSDGEKKLLEKLKSKQINLICLAGYMKLIPLRIIHEYQNCILNIHPSLLPRFGGKGFYGMKVHEAVIKSGEKESGATIHLVNEKYDEGQIIAQMKIPIKNGFTPEILAKKILKIEHKLYPETIKAFCDNKLVINRDFQIMEI